MRATGTLLYSELSLEEFNEMQRTKIPPEGFDQTKPIHIREDSVNQVMVLTQFETKYDF